MPWSRSSHSPMSFDSPYGDSGSRRRGLGDQVDVRGAVDGRRRREHDRVDALRRHRLEQVGRARDVLLVGVQGALDRDPGVLEARQVHDAHDAVLRQRVRHEIRVEDRALARAGRRPGRTRDARWRGRRGPPVQPDLPERPHHVRPDVPGTPGDQPCHAPERTDDTLIGPNGVGCIRRGPPCRRGPERRSTGCSVC